MSSSNINNERCVKKNCVTEIIYMLLHKVEIENEKNIKKSKKILVLFKRKYSKNL